MASLPTKKIPALPPAVVPLTGFEQFECVQTGVSSKVTARDFVLPIDSILTVAAVGATLPGSRQITAGIGIAFVDGGPASTLEINATGAVAGPANPTALVGLAAINGVALTYMRSDAAPALNQGIAPTWTAQHIFSLAGTGATPTVRLSSVSPRLEWNETDGAVDNRKWVIAPVSEQLRFLVLSDDGVTAVNFMTVDRTGTVIDSIAFSSAAESHSGTCTFTSSAGAVQLVSINPVAQWNETDAGVDSKIWNLIATAAQFQLQTRTDAGAAGAVPISIARTGTVVDSITLTATAVSITATTVSITGTLTFNPGILSGATPSLVWNETDQGVDGKNWLVRESSGTLVIGVSADATPTSLAASAMSFSRTGLVIDGITASVALTHTALSNRFTATGTGLTWPIEISSATPGILWDETDAAADNRYWRGLVQGEQFEFSTRNDANSGGVSFWLVNRTGTVVDSQAWVATTFTFTGTIANPKVSQLRDQFNAQVWAAGANSLDLSLGNLHRITLNGNVTLSFTNPPPNSTQGVTFTIFLLQDATGSRTVTWPASVHWSDGLTPVLTTTASRMDAVTLTTFDGGTTYYGGQVLANMVP